MSKRFHNITTNPAREEPHFTGVMVDGLHTYPIINHLRGWSKRTTYVRLDAADALAVFDRRLHYLEGTGRKRKGEEVALDDLLFEMRVP